MILSRQSHRGHLRRICSFLPSATEIVYALGLQDQLYGVTLAGVRRGRECLHESVGTAAHLQVGKYLHRCSTRRASPGWSQQEELRSCPQNSSKLPAAPAPCRC